MPDLTDEASALLTYLEQRGLDAQDACAVMGIALNSLIVDPEAHASFIQTLQRTFRNEAH
jgi:hypothetical protein